MKTSFLLALMAVATTSTLLKDGRNITELIFVLGFTFLKDDCDATNEDFKRAVSIPFKEMLRTMFVKPYTDLIQMRLPNVILHRLCSASLAIKNGISNGATIINDCLDPEDLQTSNDFVHSINLFIDQTCINEGLVLKSFVDDGSLDCLISRLDTIEENCGNLTSTTDDGEEFEDECQTLLQVEPCVLDIVKDCSTASSLTFLKSMFNSFINPFCSEYTKED